jgi:O-methyltransferase involved in polyketide biosynthesis
VEVVVSGDQPAYSWTEAEKDLMEGIDTTVPHSARIWNYWLGGKDNYPVDREAGEAFLKVYPGMAAEARANRQFLARGVTYLVTEAGMRQFLDIGTGLPTADNTHEIAQRLNPQCRVVYVDNDPLVLAHARALLTSTPEGVTDYVDADLHDPDEIVAAAAKILDFSAPIALILSGIMGHIDDDEGPHAIVSRLMDRLPSGSYLMLQDGTTVSQANADALEDYNSSGAIPYNLRTPEEIVRYFDGLELAEPGVLPIQQWRTGPGAEALDEVNTFGGIGRKKLRGY